MHGSFHTGGQTASLSESERLARLRLIRTDSIGPITWRHLIARFGSAETALEAVPDLAAKGGRKGPLRIPAKAEAEKELAALARFGAFPLFLGDSAYPALLAATEDAPPVLFAKGQVSLLARDAIGIVGTRNASAAGLKIAQMIAAGLGSAGLVVASGLARGIDAAAHAASLKGGTIACLAGGLDITYPRENAALQEKIGEEGLLVSEMPLGTEPQARHFPRRNRLISGLSLGILVVEAALRSGSLITARLAGEQGREVFAVPGSPLDPRAGGANQLLREGAILVETAADVLNEIESLRSRALRDPSGLPLFDHAPPKAPETNSAAREKVKGLLSPSPTAMDDLIRLSGLPAGEVAALVLELELGGLAVRYPGGRVALVP
ncbi:DNA-processing protein DprA [Pseudokordiimonas caeni]|uniref:DNA-processing protein DprA n=1 Tax=Pseudokordiimonas caeni TaxID=2997908 RepID=UPI002812645E|nr:DNA-processing protein DprA [Pseudokordiimonas caeni]